MIINAPKIVEEDRLFCRFKIEETSHEDELWFSLGKQYGDLVSDRTDSALAGLLIPAMDHGEDIEIEGVVSERLYYAVTGPLQEALITMMPELEEVDVDAETVKPARREGSGVAMGFSAGIDSFSALGDHYYSDVPEGFEVTHLLFNNVGSHGSEAERLFNDRYERVRSVVEEIDLPFVKINSNLNRFYDISFKKTHTPRNVSVALLLQGGIKRFFYGSAYHFKDIYVKEADTFGHIDPIVLPLLSTDGLDVRQAGNEYTRIEKTHQVAEIKESHHSLNVCVDSIEAGNCSTCWKCRRTIFTLEIAGLLDRYSAVFDIEAYRKGRWLHHAEVLEKTDPYNRELETFAKENGCQFPIHSRLFAKLRLGALSEIVSNRARQRVAESPVLRKPAKKALSVARGVKD